MYVPDDEREPRYLWAEEVTKNDRVLAAGGRSYWPPAAITRGPVHVKGWVVMDLQSPPPRDMARHWDVSPNAHRDTVRVAMTESVTVE